MSDSTHWARNSAEHEADFLQTYRHAALALEAQAPNLEQGTWAVSLDADETVLDNSLYQKERQEQCEGFTRPSWEAWVARREAKALPGTKEFLQRVHKLGGVIAIVTNRRTGQECDDTQANFQALSLPFDVMLCGSGDKEPRWESVINGTASPDLPPLKLVLWIGDNIRDFPDLDQDVRNEPDDEGFRDFGTRFFVVPNAMYGSWTSNPKQ